MAGHRTVIVQDKDNMWFATCNCKWTTGATRYAFAWQADDQKHAHLANVERAAAALRATSSLKVEYDHAVAMAADPNNPPDERVLWQQLADGYRSRLGSKDTQEDALF